MIALAAGEAAEVVDIPRFVEQLFAAVAEDGRVPEYGGSQPECRSAAQRQIAPPGYPPFAPVAQQQPAAQNGSGQGDSKQALGADAAGHAESIKRQPGKALFTGGFDITVKAGDRQQDEKGQSHVDHALARIAVILRSGGQQQGGKQRRAGSELQFQAEAKDQKHAPDGENGRRQPRGEGVDAENTVAQRGELVIKRRIFEKGLAVELRQQVLVFDEHLGGDSGHPGFVAALELRNGDARQKEKQAEEQYPPPCLFCRHFPPSIIRCGDLCTIIFHNTAARLSKYEPKIISC
ncbi:hypothetical protein SDC9_82704 [bioreactor metagenome]|uniref:Uncharacterized protein n=1 Tax=bioreactor metagenome TaxID=1076179 RepID=A0A644Z677_9ZZZZ